MKKNIRNSKRAQFYNLYVGFGTILVLFFAFMVLEPITWNNTIGQRQFDIIGAYLNTEKDLAYIDNLASMAIQDSLLTLAKNGGFASVSKCGNVDGYSSWNSINRDIEECFPNEKLEFSKLAESYLNSYLLKNKKTIDFVDKYSISPLKDSIVGISSENIYFPDKPKKLISNSEDIIKEYNFDRYKINVYANVNCDEEYIDDSYKVEIKETFPIISDNIKLNSGKKYLHADLVYSSYDESDNDLISKPKAGITPNMIGEKRGKYCYSYNPKIYNFMIQTLNSNEVKCSIQTNENSEDDYSGNDLLTWNPDLGDTSCKDSKTYLQCPGIRVYYCGKTGHETYPNRADEFLNWKGFSTEFDDPRISKYFVQVRNDDLATGYHIRSKTSFSFLIELDYKTEIKEKSVKRDSFFKTWVEDSFKYIKTRVTSSDVSKEKEYPFYYSANPSFRVKLYHDMEFYNRLYDISKKIINNCDSLEDKECISENIPKDIEYDVKISNNYLLFDIYSKKYLLDTSSTKGLEKIKYSFALYLSNNKSNSN